MRQVEKRALRGREKDSTFRAPSAEGPAAECPELYSVSPDGEPASISAMRSIASDLRAAAALAMPTSPARSTCGTRRSRAATSSRRSRNACARLPGDVVLIGSRSLASREKPEREPDNHRNRDPYGQNAERQAQHDHEQPERLVDEGSAPPESALVPLPPSCPRRCHPNRGCTRRMNGLCHGRRESDGESGSSVVCGHAESSRAMRARGLAITHACVPTRSRPDSYPDRVTRCLSVPDCTPSG